jgi:hypothetical protein
MLNLLSSDRVDRIALLVEIPFQAFLCQNPVSLNHIGSSLRLFVGFRVYALLYRVIFVGQSFQNGICFALNKTESVCMHTTELRI